MERYYVYKLTFKGGETYVGCHVQHTEKDNYITSSAYYKLHKDELVPREILIEVSDSFKMNFMETVCIMEDKRDNPKNKNFNLGNYFHNFSGGRLPGFKLTKSHKKKLSESHKGKIPWNKGKHTGPMSEEQKRRISEKLKGRVVLKSTRKKIIRKSQKQKI